MADGDMEVFFKGIDTFKANLEKSIKSDFLKSTPAPPNGDAATKTNTLVQQYNAAEKNGDAMEMMRLADLIKQNKKE